MPLDVVQCWGLFRPGDFTHSTDNPSPKGTLIPESEPVIFPESGAMTVPASETITVQGSKPRTMDYDGFQGPTRDGWSPARVRAANAEHRAWQLAARKAWAEESAAAAANVTGPEPGATYSDIRVYTRLKDGQYKYWGVKDDGMTIEDFWSRTDPENTREDDNHQNVLIDLVPAHTEPLSNSQSPRVTAAPRPRRTQKTPEVNPKHRAKKSATVTPPVNKSTRKSLATKLDAKHPGLDEQVRDITESVPKGRRSAAHPAVVERSDRQINEPLKRSDVIKKIPVEPPREQVGRGRRRKVQPGVVNSVRPKAADQRNSQPADPASASPPKRTRGRPAKENPSMKSSGKQRRPATENKAKITKPKKEKQHSSAPSSHKMRTRARGPAQHPQLP